MLSKIVYIGIYIRFRTLGKVFVLIYFNTVEDFLDHLNFKPPIKPRIFVLSTRLNVFDSLVISVALSQERNILILK